MKNFKLPKFTYEQNEETFKKLKVGDILVVIDKCIWTHGYNLKYDEVKKITPKGRIRMKSGELIDKLYAN